MEGPPKQDAPIWKTTQEETLAWGTRTTHERDCGAAESPTRVRLKRGASQNRWFSFGLP